MSALDYIKAPIAEEMVRYEQFLRKSFDSDNPLTVAMLDYIFENSGKAVRPVLCMLTASVFSGPGPLCDRTLTAAMLVEMMHTASLVHDDVIDESDLRRGKPSVKAVWQSRRAVLIGDYILAKSFATGMRSHQYDIVDYTLDAISKMCEGELLQSEHSGKFDLTRPVYDRIIYDKTACLIGTSSGVGALSVNAGEENVRLMRTFGDSIGMAFQIKDDILDYQPSAETGKTPCSDIREGKINLPLLLVMERSAPAELTMIRELMESASKDDTAVDTLSTFIKEKQGPELATKEMDAYINRALQITDTLPPSRYRDSLRALCPYITERSR